MSLSGDFVPVKDGDVDAASHRFIPTRAGILMLRGSGITGGEAAGWKVSMPLHLICSREGSVAFGLSTVA